MTTQPPAQHHPRATPTLGFRSRAGEVLECVFDRAHGSTALISSAASKAHEWITIDGVDYIPFTPQNNLLTHRVVLLPSMVASLHPPVELIAEVRQFIHRYIDLSGAFEEVAAHYILLTWIYDAFNELPYLRVRGHYGSGKSRFLLTVGSLCYKPIFASGASTISPIFRLLDQVAGTLVIDEADFWASDERSEIVKILNNGNARGFPVLRNDITPQKEFNPRAFNIFGPKIIATRHPFEDEALESRCLTEVLGGRAVRADIPVSLPHAFHDEAEALRNKLLAFRFDWLAHEDDPPVFATPGLSPRRTQVLQSLLAVAADDSARARLYAFVSNTATTSSVEDAERCVLSTVKSLVDRGAPLTMTAIAENFTVQWKERYGIAVTPRWIGSILRRLGVRPQKSHGTYIIPASELSRVRELFRARHFGDVGDMGDGQRESDADRQKAGAPREPGS